MITYIAHESNGVYSRDKRVTLDRRLRYAPYAQAGWLRDGYNHYTMYSYSSRIFTADVSCIGVEEITTRYADAAINYSRTTSRQVTYALRELGLTDNTIAKLKKFFTNGGITAVNLGREQWVNACTGEEL